MRGTVKLADLKELVVYDPATGSMMWKPRADGFFLPRGYTDRWNTKNAGTFAGALQSDGGYRVSVRKRVYELSRLAFMLIHNLEYDVLPPVVDHEDGNRGNNSALNLRAATKSQNNWNSIIRANNTTGEKGISRKNGKFRACICVNYKQYEKLFNTKEEAVTWRASKARELHKQFACGNQHMKGGDGGKI
jgi:hypothetical protein